MAFADQATLLAQRVAAEFKAVRAANKSGFTPPSGGWLQPSNMLGASGAALTSGTVTWVPLDVGPKFMSVQSLGAYCSTAQVGGTIATTLGLYADDGSGGMPLLSPAGILASGAVTAAAVGTGWRPWH